MTTDLKLLGFVPKYADAGVKYAESWVNYTNDHLPASVKPTVEKVEQTISATVAPVVTTVTDTSDKLLHVVDAQVDAAVKTAHTVIENQKQFHAQNLQHYKAARQAYLRQLESVTDFLKEKGLSGTAQYALDAVHAQVDKVKALPGYAGEQSKAAFDKLVTSVHTLLENPQVAALVEKYKPAAQFAWGKYLAVHDAVVANGTYKFAYDKSVDVLNYAQGTSLFKFASTKLYPYVSPYADPAIDNLIKAGYYQALVDHVKPAFK